MTEKIKMYILNIRDSGQVNMLDLPRVRQIAIRQGFDELVEFLDHNKKSYIRFIFYGDDEA